MAGACPGWPGWEPMNNARRKQEHGPWSWCSKAAEDRALFHGGSTLLLIYRALCRIESDTPAESKNCFYASATGIGSRCGLKARTVQRFIPLIGQAGLAVIHSGRNSGEKRSHEANRFTLLNVGQKSHPCDTETQALMTGKTSVPGGQERKEKPLKKEGRCPVRSSCFAGPDGTAGKNSETPTPHDHQNDDGWYPTT